MGNFLHPTYATVGELTMKKMQLPSRFYWKSSFLVKLEPRLYNRNHSEEIGKKK